ncbi:MAG: RNA polymerase sigma factor region1.1 domain-containing protein, partial [Xanthobacteraceae bacterium]
MATKMKSKGPAKPAAKTPPKPKVVAKVMTRPATPTPKAPLKASAKPAIVAKEDGAEKEVTGIEAAPDTPLPLLDLSDAEVKKMIKLAKKRGYVTHEQINAVLPSEEVTSDQIEDVFAMLNEMGINVVESEEQDTEEESREEEEEESGDGDLVEASNKTPAKAEKAEPGERTDDPVRMYLREMGSVELLSREGEIAIAKRIEAGREAMIAGLCESPLTFQAIIIWRDELKEGKIFLRDIIDFEATYAGPNAKSMPGALSEDGIPAVGAPVRPPQMASPATAPAASTQFIPKRSDDSEAAREPPVGEGEMDDDDLESSLSLAVIEAELKPKVLKTFDIVADSYKRLR